ncbi:MAG: hypothetical protein Q9183_007717, partial [Haloplaca sp. 2 TL-2023]
EWGDVPELETGKDGVAHLLVALGMAEKGQLARGEKSTFNEVAKEEVRGVDGGVEVGLNATVLDRIR